MNGAEGRNVARLQLLEIPANNGWGPPGDGDGPRVLHRGV